MRPSKQTAQTFSKRFRSVLMRVGQVLKRFWRQTRRFLHETKVIFLASFTKWIDPKLDQYRVHKLKNLTSEPTEHTSTISNHTDTSPKHTDTISNHTDTIASQDYTPQTIAEFLELLKRTPRSVLNARERHVIATIMNFPNVHVSEIMLPPSAITYVKDDEVLGPLTLDRLYKSGFQHFPVIDGRHRVIGLIHTTALNSLEIKETSHAREILDPKVYYLREDYTLNEALAAFLRTNCYFFIVVDRYEKTVGMLTYQMLVDYLLGETPADKFDRDSDRLAVAKRKI